MKQNLARKKEHVTFHANTLIVQGVFFLILRSVTI